MRTLTPRSGKASKGAADWNAQAGQIRAERERFGAPAAGGLTCLTTIMAGGAAPGRKGEISLFVLTGTGKAPAGLGHPAIASDAIILPATPINGSAQGKATLATKRHQRQNGGSRA